MRGPKPLTAAAFSIAVAVSGVGQPAWAATTSPARALPDVPWTVAAATIDALDFVISPITSLSTPLLNASDVIAPLAPLGHGLAVIGTSLPLAADSLRLLDRVANIDMNLGRVSKADESPAWQMPEIPSIETELTAVSSGVTSVADELVKASDCQCLPFGIDERLADALPTVLEASSALDTYAPLAGVMNELTGFSGERTYLVVIGNQAEMRPSGGAPLYAAVVTADDGGLTLADKGLTSTHFFPPMNRPVTWSGAPDNPYFAENPRTEPFVNAGRNPDFAVSGQELAAAFEAGGHPRVDGVIYLDLTFLEGLLALTGPVTVEGVGRVDSTDLADQLLDNAYDETDSRAANARRQAANDQLVEGLLNKLQDGLPALAALQHVSESTAGRHLQVWLRDEALQSTFDEIEWTGRITAPQGSDWLAWFTQSGNPSKTDVQQDRSVQRSVETIDSRSLITTDYIIANRNEPTNDPTIDERRGYRATWMRTAVVIYLPPGARGVRVTSVENMVAAPLTGARRSGAVLLDAAGNQFLRFSGWIAPLNQASISVTYSLPIDDPGNYSLVLEPQVSFTPYQATITTSGSLGRAELGPLPIEQRTTIVLPEE